MTSRRRVPLLAATLPVLLVLLVTALTGAAPTTGAPRSAPLVAVAATVDPVLAAAGDIACDPVNPNNVNGGGSGKNCEFRATSDLLLDPSVSRVAVLGDGAYRCGSLGSYQGSYAPTWGRVLGKTRPSPGNHDYYTSSPVAATGCTPANAGAAGYFAYFGAQAGERGKGWYSYDLGTWHVVVLNSNCSKVGGCTATSAQGRWLAADLASHPRACTLAYWHHPLFASVRGTASTKPLWQLLYAARADVVLNGHVHWYERMMPLDPNGVVDPARGMREFIVGTGGEDHQADPAARSSATEVLDNTSFGVLRLTLRPGRYSWRFAPAVGSTFTDSGSQSCQIVGGDRVAPTRPTGVTVTATSRTSVRLAWDRSTDDVRLTGYRVLRDGVPVAWSQTTSGRDARVGPGTSHTYTVQSFDRAGNYSTASAPLVVTTPR